MDRKEALSNVTEVTATASETKQIQQYEPSEATVSYTASVPEDVHPAVLERQLEKQAQEDAKRMITRRVEEQIRQEAEE
jgi:hypothetical protein